MDNAAVVEMRLSAGAGSTGRVTFAVVRLADLVGTPEAVAGIRLAVAAAHRPKALALLARDAKARNGHAYALGGPAHAGGRLAPEPLVAHAAVGSAAGLASRNGVGGS